MLGTPGRTNGWSYDGSFKNGRPGIWLLGWDDLPNQLDDPNVANTTIRDANFDYLTNTVAWAEGTAHALPEFALPNGEARLLRRRQGVHLAVGKPDRIAQALRSAGQGALRRQNTLCPTLIKSTDDKPMRSSPASFHAKSRGISVPAWCRPTSHTVGLRRAGLVSAGPLPVEAGARSLPNLRGHLPALDGVRGLAILMVLVFHFVGTVAPTNWIERIISS